MDEVDQLRNLCEVLGINLKQKILEEVDNSIRDPNEWIANSQALSVKATKRLSSAVERLSHLKLERLNQVKRMGSSILSYWIALSTPAGEKRHLNNLFHYVDLDSADELKEPNSLSLAFTDTVEREFNRLTQQVNDLVLRKKAKLKEIFRMTHLEYTFADTGATESWVVLEEIKSQIQEVKKLSADRQEIVVRAERLENALEEIKWYFAFTRGGGSRNERATRAQVLVQQFPRMMNALEDRVITWNSQKASRFKYDKVDILDLIKHLGEKYEAEVKDIPFALNIPRRARTRPQVPVQQAPNPVPVVPLEDPQLPQVPVQQAPNPVPVDPVADPQLSDGSDSTFESDPNDSDYVP